MTTSATKLDKVYNELKVSSIKSTLTNNVIKSECKFMLLCVRINVM